MIKVKCKYCSYKVQKSKWEHIISAIRKDGGNALKNICPSCKQEGLRFDWGEEDEYRRISQND